MVPTDAVVRAAKLLEDAVGRLLSCQDTLPNLGTYEAEWEALNLIYLTTRNVESVVALAQRDLVLLPGAMVLARAAFESSARAVWLVNSSDKMEGELRWLAVLKDEENHIDRLARRIAETAADSTSMQSYRDRLRGFRVAVEARLPSGYEPLKGIPDFASMLRSLGEEPRYVAYQLLSQYTHGSHSATWLYRRHLGSAKKLGEFIEAKDWHTPFEICWFTIHWAGSHVIDGIGGSADYAIEPTFVSEVQGAIEAVRSREAT